MRLQQSQGMDLAALSTEQLKKMIKNPDLSMMVPALQAELNNRTKTRAFLTVEVLKNSNVKPIGETGMSRLQARLVKAELQNAQAGDELTFGFGEVQGIAKIGIFLQIPDEQIERLNLAQSSHVQLEVALTVNPDGGHYVLQASEINELRSVYVPEKRRTQSLQVWEGPNGEEHYGKTAPDGYVAKRIPSYGNVTVLDVLEVNPVNLALTNAIVPTDKVAWLASATEISRESSNKNLAAYQLKQQAQREQPPVENSAVAAMAATLESSEEAISI